MESEITKYQRLRKRYKKAYTTLYTISTASNTIALGSAITGVSFLATGVLLPVTVAMEASSIVLCCLSLMSDIISKKIMVKVMKNEHISCLAASKVSSIHLLISKALLDSHISDSEFEHINNEITVYKEKKQQIQTKAHVDLEAIKKEYFQRGKNFTEKELSTIKEKINNLAKASNIETL